MKRLVDILLSLLGLLILWPLLLLFAVAISIESKGPVLFRQERIGKGGVPFTIYKFRTMVVGGQHIGPSITVRGDSRITLVGQFLRKYKLDELPQLFNIVKGEMSLVGPRPEVPQYVSLYNERQLETLKVRPGITDPASLVYSDEEMILSEAPDPQRMYVETIMPHKLALNLQYIENMSLGYDVELIVKTIIRIFTRQR